MVRLIDVKIEPFAFLYETGIMAVDFENIDRKEIQEMTWEKHNQEKWKKDFKNALDKTIDIFYNKRNILQ